MKIETLEPTSLSLKISQIESLLEKQRETKEKLHSSSQFSLMETVSEE